MSRRGARNLVSFFAFLLIVNIGFSSPNLPGAQLQLPRHQSFTLDRLCQDPPDKTIDYSNYFTKPEREGGIVYVFYNNFVDILDNTQFGYALLYGLEYASASANNSSDILAVGIYFTDDKGKLYLINKKAFDDFHQQKLTIDALVKDLMIKEVDLTQKTTPAPKTSAKR
jgi:hypothetical protein